MDDTVGELGKVFRTVTKLVREKAEDYFGNPSPLERVLRDVSDEDSCNVPNSLLREIAKSSHDAHSYYTIMQTVWMGLTSEAWQWRRIYKALCLLEYMCIFGPDRVIDDCKDAQLTLRNLCNFRVHDGRREQGGGVRQKADAVIELVNVPEALAAAKDREEAYSQKFVGIENKPAFGPTGGGFGGFQSFQPQGFGSQGGFATGFGVPSFGGGAGFGGGANPFFHGPTADSSNPFATMNKFQSPAEAGKAWSRRSPARPTRAENISRTNSENSQTSSQAPVSSVTVKKTQAPLIDLLADDSMPAQPVGDQSAKHFGMGATTARTKAAETKSAATKTESNLAAKNSTAVRKTSDLFDFEDSPATKRDNPLEDLLSDVDGSKPEARKAEAKPSLINLMEEDEDEWVAAG